MHCRTRWLKSAHPDAGVLQHAVRTASPVRAAVVRTAEAGVRRSVLHEGERRAGPMRRLWAVRRVRTSTVEGARGNRAGEVVGLAGRMVASRAEVWALQKATVASQGVRHRVRRCHSHRRDAALGTAQPPLSRAPVGANSAGVPETQAAWVGTLTLP